MGDVITPALAGGLALDFLVGEPSNRLHPVAWFGRVVDAMDRPGRWPRLTGALVAVGLSLGASVLVGGLVVVVATASAAAGIAVGALVVAVTTSVRTLFETVHHVIDLAGSDLTAARRELGALAGRDAARLDAAHVRSAALESLAENLADGIVAPLAGFALGAGVGSAGGLSVSATLGLACGCAVWIKAVDTMDSMVGYPDRPWGTGAARLDDVAMFLPARLAAVLIAFAFLSPRALLRARAGTAAVASPNSGWPMGTLAACLGVRFSKPGSYDIDAEAPWPTSDDARIALGRVGLAALAAYGLTGVVGWS